jgi:hypothetical protein
MQSDRSHLAPRSIAKRRAEAKCPGRSRAVALSFNRSRKLSDVCQTMAPC